MGRVELYHEGAWGTVCDDQWGKDDADVVCRQLGYYGETAAVGGTRFGPGTGEILLDDLGCLGWENNLFECPHTGVGNHNCHHGEDAGVICNVYGIHWRYQGGGGGGEGYGE